MSCAYIKFSNPLSFTETVANGGLAGPYPPMADEDNDVTGPYPGVWVGVV